MSQPHPPIPNPQPQGPEDDGPRTQSILLPPSQRPTAAPGPDDPPTQVAQDWTPPADPAPPAPAAGSHATEQLRGHGTGPLDLVPGFPDLPPVTAGGRSTPTLPPPSAGPGTTPNAPQAPGASSHRRSPLSAVTGARRGRAVLLSLGLAVLAVLLLELGLALDFESASLWELVPTWSALATVGALVVLVAPIGALTGRLPARTAWRTGAAGAAALAAFWVLVALPIAPTDRGFWLTAALAAAAAALWSAPGRTE
jgi:hypothetical protein